METEELTHPSVGKPERERVQNFPERGNDKHETIGTGGTIADCRDSSDDVEKKKSRENATIKRKYRSVETLALYLTFLAIGLSTSVLGPSIVTMEILLQTETRTISGSFIASGVGYLTGSIGCAFCYDRMNKELYFLSAGYLLAVSLAAAPYFPHVYGFIAANAVMGLSMGFMQAGGQSYLLLVWQSSRYRESAMQGMHTCWSIGATVGPFIISLFLVPLPDEEHSTTAWVVSTNASTPDRTPLNQPNDGWLRDITSNNVPVTSSFTRTSDIKEGSDVALVRFGYLTAASIVLLAPTVFTALFLKKSISCASITPQLEASKKTIQTRPTSSSGAQVLQDDSAECHANNHGENPPQIDNRGSKYFRVTLVALLLGLAFLCLMMGINTGQFLASYVVRGLEWSNVDGALLTTVYWGSITTGRVLSIFISAVIPARHLIFMDAGLALSGFSVMILSRFHFVLAWIAAAMIGLGVSTIFPCLILIASDHVRINGKIGGMFVLMTAVGAILGPWITSFLMERYSPKAFTFFGFACAVLFNCGLVCTKLYIRKHSSRRVNTIRDVDQM